MVLMEEIIELIEKNRISSTEVSDCLGKSGAIENLYPLNKQNYSVGPVKWVYGYNESNWEIHEQIRDVKKGDIVLVELFNCKNRAAFGSLVSKYLLLYKQAKAIVVLGNLRDVHTLIKENYPIWLYGVTPIGCFNTKNEKPFEQEIIKQRKKLYDGAIAVCDDSGVTLIPPNKINEDFQHKLEFIEEQEDIWFDCIDRKKWDTYETICLKKYQNNKSD